MFLPSSCCLECGDAAFTAFHQQKRPLSSIPCTLLLIYSRTGPRTIFLFGSQILLLYILLPIYFCPSSHLCVYLSVLKSPSAWPNNIRWAIWGNLTLTIITSTHAPISPYYHNFTRYMFTASRMNSRQHVKSYPLGPFFWISWLSTFLSSPHPARCSIWYLTADSSSPN